MQLATLRDRQWPEMNDIGAEPHAAWRKADYNTEVMPGREKTMIVVIALLGWVLLSGAAIAEGRVDESLTDGFDSIARPFLEGYCFDCHDADNMESGIRVDNLNAALEGRQPFLWQNILKQLSSGSMPPEDGLQPSSEERQSVVDWINAALDVARRRVVDKDGSVRRLTVSQYRNTLRKLLKLEDDFTSRLPADAVSKDGFLNNTETLLLSPLLIESYFEVAEEALARCMVDPQRKPTIQNFRVDLGLHRNPHPCPDKLILGANSALLPNDSFVVSELLPIKPFEFDPFSMKTRYRFIEGYEGNSTVRGWKEFDSIYHSVFACVRGTNGYPKGNPYDLISEGILLRPAIPSSELFGESSTYGPKANFKIALRELPDAGRFRVTVRAARYDDGLLLGDEPVVSNDQSLIAKFADSSEANLLIPDDGIYQIDAAFQKDNKPKALSLTVGDRSFSRTIGKAGISQKIGDGDCLESALLVVRLTKGKLRVLADVSEKGQVDHLAFTRLVDSNATAERYRVFERRRPILGVNLGFRRDCGHTLAPVGSPVAVGDRELAEFVFEGAIKNYPSPDVEKDNVNYLAGVREIGIRQEHTVVLF